MDLTGVLSKIKGTNVVISLNYYARPFMNSKWNNEMVIITFRFKTNFNIIYKSDHILSEEMQKDTGLIEHYCDLFLETINKNSP